MTLLQDLAFLTLQLAKVATVALGVYGVTYVAFVIR